VADVPPLRRRREQAIGEVREEDERERDVDVDDQPPGLSPIRDRDLEDEVDDIERIEIARMKSSYVVPFRSSRGIASVATARNSLRDLGVLRRRLPRQPSMTTSCD